MATKTWRLARISLAVILLIVGVCSTLPASSNAGDDGWRRTAQGWERLVSDEKPAIRIVRAALPASIPKSKLAPLHPLLWAAVQVSLIAAAYWRLPVKA